MMDCLIGRYVVIMSEWQHSRTESYGLACYISNKYKTYEV